MSIDLISKPPILWYRMPFGLHASDGLALVNACRDEITSLYGEPAKDPLDSLACFTVAGGFVTGAMLGDDLVACGGVIPMSPSVAEMKSIYVVPYHRGQGIGRKMVEYVESCARFRGFRLMRLQAGIRQPAARRLYESMGYRRIRNYGEHAGRDDQFCYEKELTGP